MRQTNVMEYLKEIRLLDKSGTYDKRLYTAYLHVCYVFRKSLT